MPPEKCRPVFVMKPEPQVVTEGEWAKFCCRVIGNPRPRLMWILNGRTIGPVSIQLQNCMCFDFQINVIGSLNDIWRMFYSSL